MPDKKEQTLIVVKPDGVQRSLIGEIIKRYELAGLKLVAMKMIVPDEKLVENHYLIDPDWKKKSGAKTIEAYKKKGITPPSTDPEEVGNNTLNGLKKYLTAGPVVAMVWQGMNACGVGRKIAGETEPLTANRGTIRGDYTIDSYEISDEDGRAARNILHASGDAEEAKGEIELWFDKDELIDYRLVTEEILYDVNLDGILE